MNEYIPTPTVGEVIVEEFMKPLDISPAMLANSLGLSTTYTHALLDGEVKVTPELSKRLADYFGMSELFFFRLQQDIDARNTNITQENSSNLEPHEPVRAFAFA